VPPFPYFHHHRLRQHSEPPDGRRRLTRRPVQGGQCESIEHPSLPDHFPVKRKPREKATRTQRSLFFVSAPERRGMNFMTRLRGVVIPAGPVLPSPFRFGFLSQRSSWTRLSISPSKHRLPRYQAKKPSSLRALPGTVLPSR